MEITENMKEKKGFHHTTLYYYSVYSVVNLLRKILKGESDG